MPSSACTARRADSEFRRGRDSPFGSGTDKLRRHRIRAVLMGEYEYDFGFGEAFQHVVFRADEVGKAKDAPGLYAWYVRTPLAAATDDLCLPYRRIFSERRFMVQAVAPLGEKLMGKVERQTAKVNPARAGELLDDALFAGAFAAFSPPVYLGRSKNVRSRLGQHVRALETALERPVADPSPNQIEEADTPEESSQFGARMGALLRAHEIRDFRGLFVKIVYASTNESTKRVELLLNRTFHPVLGRL